MDPLPPNTETPPPLTLPPTTSLAARLMNVFASPAEVFDEIKAASPATANWLVPTILLAIVAVLSALVIGANPEIKRQKQAMQEAILQKMVESGKMPKEAAEKAINANEAGGGGKSKFEAAGMCFLVVISLFWSALILWLGSMVLGQGFGYMRAVEIVGLAGMIGLLGAVIKTLLILTTGNMFAGPTPGLLLKDFNPMSNTVHGILSALDVIWLWALAVQAFGLARLSGASFAKAAAWVFGIWVLITGGLIMVGIAFRRLMGF